MRRTIAASPDEGELATSANDSLEFWTQLLHLDGFRVAHVCGGFQGRPAVVGHGTAYGIAVPLDGLGLGVGAVFQLALDGPHAANTLLEFLLGMAVGFVNR